MSSYLSDPAIIKLLVNCQFSEKFIARSDFSKQNQHIKCQKNWILKGGKP
jgi:hypothetical protein